MIGTCSNCFKTYKYSPSQGKGLYCSNKCQQEYLYKQNISNWLSKKITGKQKDGRPSDFVRRYLLEEANYQCSICGWGKPNPVNGIIYLEIDHINGSRENGYRENLQVLCPNCHTLTNTYKTLNKNVGYHKTRKQRLN
jgi:5-methylcytosine-specific restriction endonuclease McrA